MVPNPGKVVQRIGNMIYTIEWCEVKKTGKTNGREWKITEMTLVDQQGVKTTNVSTFDPVMNGQIIDGEITQGKYGLEFKAKKEETPKSAYKAQVIEKTMERKETSIKNFQDNKEWSIKVSSTMRMAVDLAIAENQPEAERIKAWREWLWNHWDVETDQYPPFIS